MRYMIVVKATRDSEAGVMPEEEEMEKMGRFHDEMAKAGIVRDFAGLKASANGWRIHYSDDKRTFVDGPFAETKELVAGYTIIEVGSREEAIEWTRRFPNPAINHGEGQIEVRPFFEPEDFVDGKAAKRSRERAS